MAACGSCGASPEHPVTASRSGATPGSACQNVPVSGRIWLWKRWGGGRVASAGMEPWVDRPETAAVVACLRGTGAPALLVRGPAGVGRSALVARAAAGVDGAVVTAAPSLLHDLAAATAVGDVASAIGPARIAAALRTDPRSVVVDDVHLADDRAAQLVHHLVAAVGVPVVLTAPEGAALPEPVEALRVADAVEVLPLAPLDLAGTAQLAAAAAGGPVSTPVVRRIAAACDGRPGVTVTWVHEAVASGQLVAAHGVWWSPHDPLTAAERAGLLRDGAARLARGDAVGAIGPLREATCVPVPDGEDPGPERRALALLAEAELLAGACVGPAVAAARGPHPDAAAWVARGWAAVSDGRDPAPEVAEATELLLDGHVAEALDLARLAWWQRADTRTAALLEQVAGAATGARATGLGEAAAALGDGPRLDAAAEHLATGFPLDAAHCADLAAVAHLAAGDRRAAAASAARADALLHGCEVVHLGRTRPAAPAPALSAREREIAEYVAEGWANREVADRLHLSVRTVEGHVLRICTKLGVTERTAIGPALRGLDDRDRGARADEDRGTRR